MSSGFVVWFTGLSGAGKSTLAAMLSAELRARGVHVEVLDGDEVRTHLSKGLTFSREDRDTNVRRIGYVARLVARSGACAMTAAISPYRDVRDEQRAQIENFVEVYCSCAIPALAERDPKGLYKKALAGEIKNFTGIDDPYEAPESPEVTVHTDQESKEESLARIVRKLEELGFIAVPAGSSAGSTVLATAVSKSALIAPHGGELVNRFVKGDASEAGNLPTLDLDERAERDLSMIASGAFSPLKGFMGSKDYLRVVREMRLENGLPWPLPITLAASPEAARGLAVGARVGLRARDGSIIATMDVADVWSPDKDLEAREVYRTTDTDHPGVAFLRASGSVYIGGEIQVFEPNRAVLFPEHHRDPRETRAFFAERGFRRIVGFQTHNPMHRAHEHLTKSALETVDGLLIHPLVGATSEGDVPAAVRMRGYEALIEHYYPRDRVLLAVYPAAMRHAGPREAVFHAITRKNYGCSHFIVGRDHAGFGGYYESEGAEALFDTFSPGEIGIEPLFFEDAFYSTVVKAMGTIKTAPGDASTRLAISGTALRAMLARGEIPPAELVRPEVAAILVAASRHESLSQALTPALDKSSRFSSFAPTSKEPFSAGAQPPSRKRRPFMSLNHYVTLGRSGLRVSPFCLGAMTFGESSGFGSSVEDSQKILDHYLELGGNFIDTANVYTRGHSEKILGDHLGRHPAKRDRVVIATKFYGNLYASDPNGGGAGRKSILAACEQSLRRLQTDYIDLYWMHAWDRHTPIDETMAALDDLVRSGKVRYLGFSDTPAWKVTEAQMLARFHSLTPLVALQIEYSLLERTVEGDLIPMAQEMGLGVTPWSPLRSGALSGKYTRENAGQVKGDRGAWVMSALNEKTYSIVDELIKIAKELGSTPARVALSWVQGRPGVTSTILGARTLAQLDDNVAALEITLTKEHVASLDALSKPTLNFPAEFLGRAGSFMHGGISVNGDAAPVSPMTPKNDSERH